MGDPSFARNGLGQAGEDSEIVRPILPGKVVPDSYSISDIEITFLLWLANEPSRLELKMNYEIEAILTERLLKIAQFDGRIPASIM